MTLQEISKDLICPRSQMVTYLMRGIVGIVNKCSRLMKSFNFEFRTLKKVLFRVGQVANLQIQIKIFQFYPLFVIPSITIFLFANVYTTNFVMHASTQRHSSFFFNALINYWRKKVTIAFKKILNCFDGKSNREISIVLNSHNDARVYSNKNICNFFLIGRVNSSLGIFI